jgi:hypothetical protein
LRCTSMSSCRKGRTRSGIFPLLVSIKIHHRYWFVVQLLHALRNRSLFISRRSQDDCRCTSSNSGPSHEVCREGHRRAADSAPQPC